MRTGAADRHIGHWLRHGCFLAGRSGSEARPQGARRRRAAERAGQASDHRHDANAADAGDSQSKPQRPGQCVRDFRCQSEGAGRAGEHLSVVAADAGRKFRPGRPDGSKTRGDFYIQKPGKVRFEYDDPTPIAIIANGSSLAVRDKKLATQDIYPLSQTPLRFLLSDRIDLLKDTNVVSVTADDVFISVTIEEKQALIGTSRLMLMVGAKDGQLKQWTVTDPQGYDTTVAVYNLNYSRKVDPSLFKIDFTNYWTPPG